MSNVDFTTPIPVGQIERVPKWLNCVLLVAQWLWLSMRFGSLSLPSAANPDITCGGMVGEGKLEYFSCMGEFAKRQTASYFVVNATATVDPQKVMQQMIEIGLSFPIVVKPNLGWCGYGVRLIQNASELGTYLRGFPHGETLIIQRYLPEVGEAGLFYAREPDENNGKVIGITLRYFPKVVGDGSRTIQQLIQQDDRLRRLGSSPLHESAFDPARIPERGEEVRLATIGSTRVGGLYCDGGEYISKALNETIDAIAKDMGKFYVGRFDVRYEDLEKLQQGIGFTIIEVNGAGSEAVHAWDPKYSLWQSYHIVFEKQRLLFRIGAANRRKGHKPIGLLKLAKLHFRQQSLIKRYPFSN